MEEFKSFMAANADELDLDRVHMADTTHYRTDPEVTSLVVSEGDLPFVGTRYATRAPVNQFNFAYHKFGPEAFELVDPYRAPGQRVKSIDFTKIRTPGQLRHFALAAPFDRVYDGQAWGDIPVDWKAEKASAVRLVIERYVEYLISSILTTQANYTNKATPSTKWSAGGTPVADIDTALDTVEDAVGIRPDVILFGQKAWRKFKRNSDVTDRIKYVNPAYGAKASITPEMVKDIFDVKEVLLGGTTYKNAAGTRVSMWNDNVVVGVRPPGRPSIGIPVHAYSFTLTGYPTGITFSEEAAFSDYAGWADAMYPTIVGDTFGYLLYDTVA